MAATRMQEKLGICQWFHYEDYSAVRSSVRLMRELGVRHLRTGVSWADYHRARGKAWYDWQMAQLEEFDVLLSVWHTPPSIAEGCECAGPPRRLEDFGDFIWQLIDEYGHSFSHLELWNEPNNRLKWAFDKYDPCWAKFGRMIGHAASVARSLEVPTVLGGMVPVDHHWLQLVESYGALEDIDIVAIHGFPHMWWGDQPNWDWYRDWKGWDHKIAYIARYTDKPIWITETGLATWDMDSRCVGRYALQCDALRRAAHAPAERVYWYCLLDLAPEREAIEGFHVDENEYHLGLLGHDFAAKPSFDCFGQLLLAGGAGPPCQGNPAAAATP